MISQTIGCRYRANWGCVWVYTFCIQEDKATRGGPGEDQGTDQGKTRGTYLLRFVVKHLSASSL